MSPDEGFHAASQLLVQRGQLLNGHLLRLLDGDKDLFQIVRARLIAAGIAEDRSGVGLALTELVGSKAARHNENSGSENSVDVSEASSNKSPATDWWLLKSGVTQGPLELVELCDLCRRGEIESAVVVRHGNQGPWKPLDNIPEVAVARRDHRERSSEIQKRKQSQTFWYSKNRATATEGLVSESNSVDSGKANASDRGASVEAGMSSVIQDTASNAMTTTNQLSTGARENKGPVPATKKATELRHEWLKAANLAGGQVSFAGMLVAVIGLSCIWYWWRLPPSNDVIFQEFNSCGKTMQRMRERRVSTAEWTEMERRIRPRIQLIANRLKPFASDAYPVQNALYLAATKGLLPMLEYSKDPSYKEQEYLKHMADAQKNLKR